MNSKAITREGSRLDGSNTMQRLLRSVTAAATLGMALASTAFAAPSVTVAQGSVQGIDGGNYHLFRNIPYAQPPVGNLRWQAPQPAGAWASPLDGTGAPRKCLIGESTISPQVGEEDCLVLHVTKPAGATSTSNLPVMVWMHGGAFVIGSGGSYNATALATENNMVVVTINYRLGAMGYMALEGLRNEAPDGTVGNYGTLDEIAALKWVQNNITAFGGNRNNVTIAGQSAGADGVLQVLGSPLANGLFHKAITQSATQLTINIILSVNDAIATGHAFANKMGCTDAATRLACMRGKTGVDLVNSSALTLDHVVSDLSLGFSPVLDGVVLKRNPLDSMTLGLMPKVPMLMGSNRNEARSLIAALELEKGKPQGFSQHDVNGLLDGLIDGPLGVAARVAINAAYPAFLYDNDPSKALSAGLTDYIFSCPNLMYRQRLAPQMPVYAYEFDDANSPPVFMPTSRSGLRGSTHADELPYLFSGMSPRGDGMTPMPMSSAQKELAVQMRKYWGNFMRTGNPNGSGVPNWPKFNDTQTAWVNLGPFGLFKRPENRTEFTQKLKPGAVSSMYVTPGNLLDSDYTRAHKCGILNTLAPFGRLLAPLLF